MELRTIDAERDAIVKMLAPRLGVLHHKESGYDLNFVLFSGTGEVSNMARRYTAEALCDLFADAGVRLVVSDELDLDAIADELNEERDKAAAEAAEAGAPTMQLPESEPLPDGKTLADVAPALIHKPERDKVVEDNTPLGRLMAGMDPRTLQTNKATWAAYTPAKKARQFIDSAVKRLLERQGCSVLIVDNSDDGMKVPTKVTLHVDLPSDTLTKGTKRK
ncbi:MAG TPA: hypothetical protein VGG84_10325 [Gemmatimonadaceae bacterium]